MKAGKPGDFETFIDRFQQTSMRIKHSLVPVVAAVRGMAFGGGCEFQMHSARTVAALESYIGLVEAGVGLLPAGGGLKELALRASQRPSAATCSRNSRACSKRSRWRKSPAARSKRRNWACCVRTTSSSSTPTNCSTSRRRKRMRWRTPDGARRCRIAPSRSPATSATATFKAGLVNMLEGRFISEHDMEIASRIADTLVRRPDRTRFDGRRTMAARPGTRALHRARTESEDAGAHRAHDEDRQAAAQLRARAQAE